MAMNLEDFISAHRAELIRRCEGKVAQRSPPAPPPPGEDHAVPQLLDQVVDELRHGRQDTDEITRSATRQGHRLLTRGFSIGQVVHGYGDVCQSITELAVELAAPIGADEFRTLNRCLDDAIAGAVTEHARGNANHAAQSDAVRSLVDTATVAFEALQRGDVGVGGSTGRVVYNSLLAIRALTERSPA